MHLLVALLLATPAHAATLRPLARIDAPVVLLSDLFNDIDGATDRTLGTAPAPGSRIVVEARQLTAIARQYGIEWRPASTSDRVVIDRPGRVLPRDIVLAALRTALTDLGAGSDLEIDIGGFSAPMVPPSAAVSAGVEQLDWDAGTGRVGFLTVCEKCRLQVEFLLDRELTDMQAEQWRQCRTLA